MGVTERLATFAAATRFRDIPAEIVTLAKERILDTLGVTLGGSAEACTPIARSVVEGFGGRPQATLIGGGGRTSEIHAAFVNGVAAHALDYDDTSQAAMGHISVCTLPAILAVAEATRASGRRVLEAYILGYEVEAKIGLGLYPDHILLGWHPVPTLGTLGAAVGAGKVLGLDAARMRVALGVAGSEASGLRRNIGTMTKPFHAGHAARNGVMAARLAQARFTANPDVLEGVPGTGHDHFGLAETFNREGHYHLERMVEGLGDPYEFACPRTYTKNHPGATAPAVPIDTTIALVTENDIQPDQVERVECRATPVALAIGCYPRPKTGLDARYSLWYGVAVSILDRAAGLKQYTDRRVRADDVQRLLERVDVVADPELKTDGLAGWGTCAVTITLKDGRRVSARGETAKGYPDRPMRWDDIAVKYRECAEEVLAPAEIERSMDLIRKIDRLGDVGELVRALVPSRRPARGRAATPGKAARRR